MDLKTLKRVRLLAPGLMAALLLWIPFPDLFPRTFKELGEHLAALPTLALAFVIGTIYHLFIRRLFFSSTYDSINENIRRKLLEIGGIVIDSPRGVELLKDIRLMNIFYNIIDHDESLKQRRDLVMGNGAKISICEDLGVILLLAATLRTLTIEWSATFDFNTIMAVIVLVFGLLCLTVFRNALIVEHQKLSNYQLDYISQLKKADVKQQVKALWN